jgi:hypothetical protein
MFWGFFCAYLAVGAFFNLLLMMLCYHQHRFAAPARNVLLCQVSCYGAGCAGCTLGFAAGFAVTTQCNALRYPLP